MLQSNLSLKIHQCHRPENMNALTVQLLQSPHQPETWRRLVNVAEATGNISKISTAYDVLLKQYPNTVCGGLVFFHSVFVVGPLLTCAQVSAQIQYINHFALINNGGENICASFEPWMRS